MTAPNGTPPKPKIVTSEGQTVLRLIPALANEIGLNESIVLLQIAYWIGIGNNLRDGDWWTYQSLDAMQEKAFPFFSTATISRAISSLIKRDLLKVGNYNRHRHDRTRWFALNIEAVRLLESVGVMLQDESSILQNETSTFHNATSILQNEKWILQNEISILQNETTLPENTPETTTDNTPEMTSESSSYARAREGAYAGEPITTTTSDESLDMQQKLQESASDDPAGSAASGLLSRSGPTAPPPSSAPPPSPAALADDALWRAYVAGGGIDSVPASNFGEYAAAWRALIEAGATPAEVERMTRDRLRGRDPARPYRFTFLPQDLAEWRRTRRPAAHDASRYTAGRFGAFVQTGIETAQIGLGG